MLPLGELIMIYIWMIIQIGLGDNTVRDLDFNLKKKTKQNKIKYSKKIHTSKGFIRLNPNWNSRQVVFLRNRYKTNEPYSHRFLWELAQLLTKIRPMKHTLR